MSVLPYFTYRTFTIEEYRRMAETGILRPDEKVELLDGQIVAMSPIGRFHNAYVNRLTRLLFELASSDFSIQIQGPVQIKAHNEPEPDLALLTKSADDYEARIPLVTDTVLLIEVADSSLEKDKHIKIPLYAAAGVPEVWIVNIVQQQLAVYKTPQAGKYTSIETLSPDDIATLPNGKTLALNRLFL